MSSKAFDLLFFPSQTTICTISRENDESTNSDTLHRRGFRIYDTIERHLTCQRSRNWYDREKKEFVDFYALIFELILAPPHGHDVLALHRHGHKFGGLPLLFWISLIFLIIVFHLFLLKIVLNEMGFFKHKLPTYTHARVL